MRRAAAIVAMLALALGLPGVAAYAQTPSPNVQFRDWAPGHQSYTTNGLIVEGLGLMNCAYSLTSVERATVSDINSGHATITEISPQNYCIPGGGQHIGAYEAKIIYLIKYVEANAPLAYRLWGGIMLDEEPDFQLDLKHLYALNNWLNHEMHTTPGITWWYTENATWSGAWSQSQFNLLTHSTGANGFKYGANPAPQIYNSYMAAIANATGFNYQLVTWNPHATYPWDGLTGKVSYASRRIGGAPYNQKFGTRNYFQWQNEFLPP